MPRAGGDQAQAQLQAFEARAAREKEKLVQQAVYREHEMEAAALRSHESRVSEQTMALSAAQTQT